MGSILEKINIGKLRMYVSGSYLSFLCIIYQIENHPVDSSKINKILGLFEQNLKPLSSFIDSIETFSYNMKQSSETIQNEIGTIDKNSFKINLNKMKLGKKYLIEYKTSQYVVKKEENSDLIVSEMV